jgi:hypothetical protein
MDLDRGDIGALRCLNLSWPGIAVRRTASLPLAYARPSTSSLLFRLGRGCPGHLARRRASLLPGHDEEQQSPPHLPTRQVLHDFLAAAADRIDLDLAVDALDLDAAHVAGAAENLHCFKQALIALGFSQGFWRFGPG